MRASSGMLSMLRLSSSIAMSFVKTQPGFLGNRFGIKAFKIQSSKMRLVLELLLMVSPLAPALDGKLILQGSTWMSSPEQAMEGYQGAHKHLCWILQDHYKFTWKEVESLLSSIT